MKLAVTILSTLLLIGSTRPVSAGDPPDPEQSWERYEILVERNAFSRTRGPRHVARAVQVRPPRPPESFVVLVGIYEQEDGIVAFLEDVRGGSQKVNVGDTIAGGKVTAITIDKLVFEKDGESRSVEVGGRLGLVADTSAGEDDPQIESGSGRPEAPSSSGGGAAESILEKLRRRRAQELNKK